MKLFIEGDLQISSSINRDYNNKSIHYLARERYIEWVLSNPKLNNPDIEYFSLGDLTDSSLPTPNDSDLLFYYMSNLKCNKKHIMAGNHDYNRKEDSYSFKALRNLPEITTYLKFQEVSLGSLNCIVLPYYYDNVYPELGSMKEEYEKLTGNYDFVFFHFEDETMSFGEASKFIDISKIKGKRIGGHIHVGGDNYLESPVPNKSNEMLDKRHVYLLDTETKVIEEIEIPSFIEYQTINYPDLPEIKPNILVNYEIKDYVNKNESIKFYKDKFGDDFFIYKMHRKSLQESSDNVRSDKVRTIPELWKDYKIEKKVHRKVASIVETYIH